MAKRTPRSRSKSTPSPSAPPSRSDAPTLLERLEEPKVIGVFFLLVFIGLVFLYKPIAIDGLDSQGGDVISNIGNTKQLKAIEAETGERPLWNAYMFAGTPIYHRLNAVSWSVDNFIWQIDPVLDWRVWYLFLGALGMFLLARYLGMNALTAMIASLAYILIPHSHALIVVGHFAKLRALMWMPFVLLTFLLMIERRNLLHMFLFTAAFALQMRTQHYQIIFYTLLLLAFSGMPTAWRLIRAGAWSTFGKAAAMLAASIVLVVLIVAQPLFITRDYTPYSTRGGNAVTLDGGEEGRDTKGVGFEYATNWSYTLEEFWNLVVPRFHGGTSQELYTGDAVPQLRNRVLPTYWGELPFTQSYEYLSVILAFLALVGIVYQWKRPIVKSLTLLTVLALLLSLGKHFAPLYKLFFYYLPYFDKFRVPMMILTLVSFNACLLAGIGLHHLLANGLSGDRERKIFFGLTGGFLALLAIPWLFASSFDLAQADELQRYARQYGSPQQAQQLMEMLKAVRLEILTDSALRSLLFFAVSAGLLLWMVLKSGNRMVVGGALLALVVIDLGSVSTDYLQDKFVDLDAIERRTYGETRLDQIVKSDTDPQPFRVLPPLRGVAQDSRYTYHYQSIGGYSAAKLQTIQDIITNNLVAGSEPGMPINLDVLNMLNGKYVFANNRWNHPALEYLGSTSDNGLHLFRNREVLPRAFFVDSVTVIPDGEKRLRFMNGDGFDPARLAILERDPETAVQAPDSSTATVSTFTPDQMVLDVYTDRTALLVVSEVYYPRGWTATLEDGTELPIYKTNHLLRSVVIPAGRHTLTMTFHPTTYYTGIWISWIGWIIVYAGLAFLLYRAYGDRLRARLAPKGA